MMLGTSENGIYHGFIMVYPRNGNLSLFKDLNLSLRHHFSCYQSSLMIYLLKSAIFLGRLLDCQSISIMSKCISINIPSTTSIFPTFHLFLSLSINIYTYIYIHIDTHTGWPIIKTNASQWHRCDLRPGTEATRTALWLERTALWLEAQKMGMLPSGNWT